MVMRGCPRTPEADVDMFEKMWYGARWRLSVFR